MRAILPTLLLFLATALPAWSQWHSSDPAHLFERFPFGKDLRDADNTDFARFREAFEKTTLDIGPLPDLREYRLVWEVTCEAGTTSAAVAYR